MKNKYRVAVGSLVTKLKRRTFIVSASDESEAIEKAKDRFYKVCENSTTYIDVGGDIMVDEITEITQ